MWGTGRRTIQLSAQLGVYNFSDLDNIKQIGPDELSTLDSRVN